jgi:hypothetical protein
LNSKVAPCSLLHRYVRLETTNPDEAAYLLNSVAVPHAISLSGGEYHARISSLQLSVVGLGFATSKGRVRTKIGPDSSTYLVLIGWRGQSECQVVGHAAVQHTSCSAIQSPGDFTNVSTDSYMETVAVAVEEAAIRRETENQLGRALSTPVRFEPLMSSATIAGQAFRHRVVQLCVALDNTVGDHPEGLLRFQQAERSMVALLVSSQPHIRVSAAPGL